MDREHIIARINALRTDAADIARRLRNGETDEWLLRRADDVEAELASWQRKLDGLDSQARRSARFGGSTSSPLLALRGASSERDFLLASVNAFDERGGAGKVGHDLSVRALIDTTALNGQPARLPGVIEDERQPSPSVVDLLPVAVVQSGSVEYLSDVSGDPLGAAAETAEGQPKPEASFSFQPLEERIATIAAWVPVTRQAVDDEPSTVAHVEERLRRDLRARLNRQLLVGDGVAPNLRGLLNRSGIGTYVSPAGEAGVIVARRAIAQVAASGHTASAIVANPATALELDLDTNSDGSWRGMPPGVNAPIIPDPAMPVGQLLVGDFRAGASLLLRDAARVLVSDSHGTNFTANVLVILAEMRAGLAVYRPSAFVHATITPAV